MRPVAVVEGDVTRQAGLGAADRVIGMQVHLFVLDRAPQALYEDVVAPTGAPVHADLDAALLERPRERLARKLTALIGVEDLWLSVLGERLFECFQAECGVHANRHPMRQYPPAGPVDDRAQVDPA